MSYPFLACGSPGNPATQQALIPQVWDGTEHLCVCAPGEPPAGACGADAGRAAREGTAQPALRELSLGGKEEGIHNDIAE